MKAGKRLPKKKAKEIKPQIGDFKTQVAICLFLSIATFFVYWQVSEHDFIGLDTGVFVFENHRVQEGLSWENLVYAFTTTDAANWHPLTWLSHMLDCQFYGLNPGWHHFTNLLFHIANTLLLFMVLNRMTGAMWKSAFVAGLFALHPLHIESVAWVAARKDVLSTFFWMLTLWLYLDYVHRPGVETHVFMLLSFILGLMVKPMLVTLPFVLLLLDYWPLGRVRSVRLIWEKVPLFALSAACSVVTFFIQEGKGAVSPIPLLARIDNALVSYAIYIEKMFFPHDLAVFYPHFYPHQEMLPICDLVGAVSLLMLISLLVIRWAQIRPYLLIGWLWYLGTLVPVIGLIQVGRQALADRYTYVPLIGAFIMIAWGIPELVAKWRYRKAMLSVLAGAVLVTLATCTWFQLRHWKDDISLFSHTLKVTTDRNHVAHYGLGRVLWKGGNLKEATKHFEETLKIYPGHKRALRKLVCIVDTHHKLGIQFTDLGKLDEAIDHFSEAVRIYPDFTIGHLNLGGVLARQGRFDLAAKEFNEVLRIFPGPTYVPLEATQAAGAHYSLGLISILKHEATKHFRDFKQAIYHLEKALVIDPDFGPAQEKLALLRAGKDVNGK